LLLTTGSQNTGTAPTHSPVTPAGVNNSAAGFNALVNNTVGTANSAIGANALFANTAGINNAAVGMNALGTPP